MNNRWIKISLWIIVFQIIGASLGILTQSNIHSWYDHIAKSSLTPPARVFSIVWPILYVLLAMSGYLLWQDRRNPKIKPALYCFIVQILMNWAWTPIFFYFHWIGFSFFWIIMITFCAFATIFFIHSRVRMISVLLMPYFLWLIFASYLNGVIWLLN